MKWLFAILVVLNLIIFGNVVTQKMQAPPPAPPVASQPTPAVVAPTTHAAEQAASAADAQSDAASAVASTPVVTKAEPAAANKKSKPATPAATTPAAPTEAVVVSGNPQGGACSATVTLSEDVYHRIKGLLNRWPNAASRVVVNNQTAAADTAKQYQVTVPVVGDSNEQVISLLAKGFKPTPSGNSISLGVYQNRLHAEQLRDRLSAAGFSAGIVERSSGGGQALTSAKYQVLFMQIGDQDAKELSAIVRPYAPLQRKPCGKK